MSFLIKYMVEATTHFEGKELWEKSTKICILVGSGRAIIGSSFFLFGLGIVHNRT